MGRLIDFGARTAPKRKRWWDREPPWWFEIVVAFAFVTLVIVLLPVISLLGD